MKYTYIRMCGLFFALEVLVRKEIALEVLGALLRREFEWKSRIIHIDFFMRLLFEGYDLVEYAQFSFFVLVKETAMF